MTKGNFVSCGLKFSWVNYSVLIRVNIQCFWISSFFFVLKRVKMKDIGFPKDTEKWTLTHISSSAGPADPLANNRQALAPVSAVATLFAAASVDGGAQGQCSQGRQNRMAAPVKLSKLLVLVKVQTLIPTPAPAVLLLWDFMAFPWGCQLCSGFFQWTMVTCWQECLILSSYTFNSQPPTSSFTQSCWDIRSFSTSGARCRPGACCPRLRIQMPPPWDCTEPTCLHRVAWSRGKESRNLDVLWFPLT